MTRHCNFLCLVHYNVIAIVLFDSVELCYSVIIIIEVIHNVIQARKSESFMHGL